MPDITPEELQTFITACHQAARYDLLRYSSGNMSWRFREDRAAVTASSSWLGELTAEQVVICKLDDGTILNNKKPSIETKFHLGILRHRPDANVVLHFQSPYATAVACGNPADTNFDVIIEIPFYIGTPAWVDYHQPGSAELAEAVIDSLRDHDLALLRNHGMVTLGKDFPDTLQRAGFFELACQILLTQPRLSPLPLDQADHLRALAQQKKSSNI